MVLKHVKIWPILELVVTCLVSKTQVLKPSNIFSLYWYNIIVIIVCLKILYIKLASPGFKYSFLDWYIVFGMLMFQFSPNKCDPWGKHDPLRFLRGVDCRSVIFIFDHSWPCIELGIHPLVLICIELAVYTPTFTCIEVGI